MHAQGQSSRSEVKVESKGQRSNVKKTKPLHFRQCTPKVKIQGQRSSSKVEGQRSRSRLKVRAKSSRSKVKGQLSKLWIFRQCTLQVNVQKPSTFRQLWKKTQKNPKKHGLSDNAGFPPHVEAWEMSLGRESDGERKQMDWRNVLFEVVNVSGVRLLHF